MCVEGREVGRRSRRAGCSSVAVTVTSGMVVAPGAVDCFDFAHVAVEVCAVAPGLGRSIIRLVVGRALMLRCVFRAITATPGSVADPPLPPRAVAGDAGRDLEVAGEDLYLLADNRPVGVAVLSDGLGTIPQKGDYDTEQLQGQLCLPLNQNRRNNLVQKTK